MTRPNNRLFVSILFLALFWPLIPLSQPAPAFAREEVELCSNAIDDDYDGLTDEEPCLAVGTSSMPVSGDGVIPELWYTGNLGCADIGFATLYGFKIDGTPLADTYPFITNENSIPPTILDGGYMAPDNYITISNLSLIGDNIVGFDWDSTLPVAAVIVKAQDASVYVFDPEDFADTGLGTPYMDRQIDYVEFCYDGNPSCQSLGLTDFSYKVDVVVSGEYDMGESNSLVLDTPDGYTFDWSTTLGIDAVIVKGGPYANLYIYTPEAMSNAGEPYLHAPVNPGTFEYYALSHVEFCYDYEGDLCAGVTCPLPTSDCLMEGVCDPGTGQCNYDPKPAGNACGDPSDTACDEPDSCDGAGVCLANLAPTGTVCRNASGICDVAEFCTGSSAECPGDVSGTCTLCGNKFYDSNANGIWDEGEVWLTGWSIGIKSLDYDESTVTDIDGRFIFTGLAEGDYQVCENSPNETNWMQTSPAEACYTVHVPSAEASTCTLDFGNLCLGGGLNVGAGFWLNKNGRAAFLGNDNGADALALLVSINLWTDEGTPFDPSTYAEFKPWLADRGGVNMAYKLSSQLAAMMLNIQKEFVDSDALIFAPNTMSCDELGFAPVSAIAEEANAELALHGYTLTDSEYRVYQEALKDALEYANKNLNFVQGEVCMFSFPIEP